MAAKTNPPAPNDPTENRPFYQLRLFVAGDEPNSLRARATVERLCDENLRGRYEIQVVDVFEDYQAAIDQRVIVVPTLIIESPPPRRVIVGSLETLETLKVLKTFRV
jgi:circadian clock protein KaiB